MSERFRSTLVLQVAECICRECCSAKCEICFRRFLNVDFSFVKVSRSFRSVVMLDGRISFSCTACKVYFQLSVAELHFMVAKYCAVIEATRTSFCL